MTHEGSGTAQEMLGAVLQRCSASISQLEPSKPQREGARLHDAALALSCQRALGPCAVSLRSLMAWRLSDVVDLRTWVTTDRPEERIAIGSPLPNVRLMSVRSSDRCWSEYHSSFKICLVHRHTPTLARFRTVAEHEARAGDLMAFEPGDHHVTVSVRGRAHFDVLGLEPRELEQAAWELGVRGAPHFKSAKMRSMPVARALERFVGSTSHAATRLSTETLYAELLNTLLEHCSESPVTMRRSQRISHARIRAVRNWLRDNCEKDVSLAELAAQAKLSRFAFAHAFTRYVGVPAHAYLKLCRASEARKRIERGASISEVAAALGFSDVPALTRALTAAFGVPPARWRRCFRANSDLFELAERSRR
jgi:AraC-like DNA-binding protein